ncbi:peroxisomal hydratase-dehydrogenase-epimerase-like [Neodiprion virginianus]|uniref:peroxisomal hydratase-dehydrogenase-epimerase-like n=1 Tax=Neodiprion virginianus TaxID=2961670 RepID=UPI001EE763BE|nr:peroxisomal hydratase-dehydrogenase-epimerase-like [Neodiprion virginianus]
MQIKNKIALVTGGAIGIGFAYGTELLRNGAAHLAILDLATSPGQESANKLNVEFGDGRAIFVICDVTKDSEFKAAFVEVIKELGGLDIVINNAGIVNEWRYDLAIDVNLTAVVRGTMLGLQHMGKDKGGKGGVIVNTASIYGLEPSPWSPVYAATKHGVVGLSRSFGLPYYYDKTCVKVLTICPSFTDTRFLREAGDCLGPFVDAEVAMNDTKSQSIQKPEDVAKALVDIISRGQSGGVWISEAGELVSEVFIPDRFTLTASSRKQQVFLVVRKNSRQKLPKWIYICLEMDFTNKVVLLTGGAMGIGFEYAKELLRNGVKHLAILDLPTSSGAETADKLNGEFRNARVIFIVCDVTNDNEFEAAFARTVKEFGGLDIVINNAGILNEKKWKLMIDINVTAVVKGTMLGLQYMGKDQGGKGGIIVNTASIFGLDPVEWFPIYDATKFAVIGLSRSFGLPYHYEKTGVTVLAMCPGVTDTALAAGAGNGLGSYVDPKLAIDGYRKFPLHKPEVVGKALVEIIRRGKSGSVWISEGGKPVTEVFIPDRFELIASSRK